jgi:hypothetical protein
MRIPIQQAQITTTNDALFFCKNWNKWRAWSWTVL